MKKLRTVFAILLLAAVGMLGAKTPASAQKLKGMASFDKDILKALQSSGADKKIYRDLFGKPMPSNVRMLAINFKGLLKGLSVTYTIPKVVPQPEVGDEQHVFNCGVRDVDSTVQLGIAVVNSYSHSYSKEVGRSFQTEVSIETEYEAKMPLIGGSKTTVGVKMTGGVSDKKTWTNGTSTSKTVSYSLSKTVRTPGGFSSISQLVYERAVIKNVPFTMKLYAEGDTEVLFSGREWPNNEMLVTTVGKGYCLDVWGNRRDPGRVIVWDCHAGENQRWTYTKENELRIYKNYCLTAGVESFEKRGPFELIGRIRPLRTGSSVTVQKCGVPPRGNYFGGPNSKEILKAYKSRQQWGPVLKIGRGGKTRRVQGGQYRNGKFCVGTAGNVRRGGGVSMMLCKNQPQQQWRPAPSWGKVKLEKYLKDTDRIFTIKGKFKGNFTSNRSYFYAMDKKMSKQACEEQNQTVGMSASNARRTPAAKSPDAKKGVIVKRLSKKEIGKSKVLARKFRKR